MTLDEEITYLSDEYWNQPWNPEPVRFCACGGTISLNQILRDGIRMGMALEKRKWEEPERELKMRNYNPDKVLKLR